MRDHPSSSELPSKIRRVLRAKTKVVTGKAAGKYADTRARRRDGSTDGREARDGGKIAQAEGRKRRGRSWREKERDRKVRRRTQPSNERLTTLSPSSSIEDTLRLSVPSYVLALARRPVLTHSTTSYTYSHADSRAQKAVVTLQRPARPPRPALPLVNPRTAGVFPPSPCFRGPFQPPRSTPCPAGHVPIQRRHAIVRSNASRSALAARSTPP